MSRRKNVRRDNYTQPFGNWYQHIRNWKAMEAIRNYEEIMKEQIKSDEETTIGVISSCERLEELKLGREFNDILKKLN
ncbi:conserved hypothetical protein [Ricinus communis]|uniref:Uncharacterized protein n=1 Tax=Ricinus communis TaxID=3988 RepID=B9RIA9_RICCO|nr:conserved hypothetical protein [Ricinus communis]